ncbi:MAG: TRAP transporter fused permease subunit [Treponema sp.]|jgi:TRAP transporter 4TM/12TM fusion protein|nr:TRAP transporter fused permease subunit [Treponema sp.]
MSDTTHSTVDGLFKRDRFLVFRLIALIFPVAFLLTPFIPIPEYIIMGSFIWFIWILTLAFKPFSRKEKTKERIPWYDWIMIIAGTLICAHYILNYQTLMNRMGLYDLKDYVIIIAAFIISLETARRTFGWVLPLVAIGSLGFLIYAGFMPDQILGRIFLGEMGIFGSIADVFCRYVLLFMVFGTLMERAGGTEFLYRLILRLRKVKGGPAKAAVIGSAILGCIMGSSAGNVAVTGSMTIPMMKKVGYKSYKAGAIEVAASLGGEITPPVMGAAAFLIVANTGIPYREVILYSILPAILYYIPIFATIHLEAQRYGIEPEEAADSTAVKMNDFFHLIVPPIILVGAILIGFSATYGAAAGIISVIIVSQFKASTRLTPKRLADALIHGALSFLNIGPAAAVLGFIMVGVVLAGMPTQFGNWAIGLTGGFLPLVIFVVFIMGLILGMGLPIVGSYLILATVAGPALGSYGLPILAIHLLIMWFCETAAVTPPVCLATFVACGIAGSKLWPTAKEAMRLIIGMYIIPLLFIYTALISGDFPARFLVFAFAALGFLWYSIITSGYLRGPLAPWIRIGGCILLPCFFLNFIYLKVIAAVLFGVFVCFRFVRSNKPGSRKGSAQTTII